ncbi:MAG: Rne/Rng family ribonuclease [Acidobacteria bacterium]|nr:Rne/Rng family ribonuclease [Acidobacteriota bacterium]
MDKELFVSSTPHETKLAIVEDDQLTEIYFERENEYTLAGSIYKGRVTRVLPGMQSAFVDIGLERDAFLYVTDFMEEHESDEELETSPLPSGSAKPYRSPQEPRERNEESRLPQAQERGNGSPTAIFEGGGDFDEAVAEPADSGDEEESEAEEEGGTEEEAGAEGEGVRRWRGRRRRGGRRKGRGPEEQPQRSEEAAAKEIESQATHSEHPGKPPAPAPAAAAEPSGYEPMILPGESIAKFSRGTAAPAPSQSETSAPAPEAGNQSYPRPRREGDRPDYRGRDRGRDRWHRDREQGRPRRDFDEAPASSPPGYVPIVLPGESIAKYRSSGSAEEAAPPRGSAEEAAPPRSLEGTASAGPEGPPQAQFSGAPAGVAHLENRQEMEAAETAAAAASSEAGEAQARWQEHEEFASGPETRSHSADSETIPAGEPEFQPTGWNATADEHQPGLSSQQNSEHSTASGMEEAAPAAEFEEGAAQPEVGAGPVETEFAPGTGHLEEEEIEEEEAEALPLSEEFDDEDFEELEEHIIDRVADRAGEVAAGLQLTEEVEETETERRSEQGCEGLESAGETADVESEFAEAGEYAEMAEPHSEEPDSNGRAEVRGPAGTAGFQQRQERPFFDRRRANRFGRRGGGPRRPMRRYEPRQLPQISELLKEGQEILVQIAKEPIARKGARITSHIALPGRFLVYMPTVDHIGVSRKISSEEERQRLKRIVLSERENGHGGFIVRTAADRADEKELRADIQFLKNLWNEIRERAQKAKPPALIYHDLNLVERILRDQVNQNFSTIWVDSEQEYERVVRFVGRFQPGLVKRVKLYTKEAPLFEQFNIQEEINKALKSKVWLKSGGYIVINQTEALVAIDVNTGKYVGKTARLEDTIVKTNVDAIKEIVRQIRLRDLGGIIVIDFIDMDERRNRQRVMQALEEALRQDRAPSKVLQFNDFGLVAITRKRVKQSLERTLGTPCPYCSATGLVKSVTTVCNEIWGEMRKMTRHFEKPDVMLRVNPEVAKALKQNNGRWIQELEELTGRNLIVKSDPTIHQEQFDVT